MAWCPVPWLIWLLLMFLRIPFAWFAYHMKTSSHFSSEIYHSNSVLSAGSGFCKRQFFQWQQMLLYEFNKHRAISRKWDSLPSFKLRTSNRMTRRAFINHTIQWQQLCVDLSGADPQMKVKEWIIIYLPTSNCQIQAHSYYSIVP